ncbi:tRNA (adenosine(37)-N6)-threonylcarbamoyltransferase complex ATPase subunit type 1 TsaE [Melissococcus plutonius]|uniref:tRNA threonylcarbamoyladenosine biosynthesis protein TsaE n=1 Tax=Melissococcus plutonius (strain ATCC 35311 / DSM 29964 / CIP 104052 / LMG 20360 / NCIMB 702443) TaxID=940190 RepID=F3Y9N1_MELPT|nr:tRNA (adenosine(37)-N6)-threonylcarbamoyltransferase complex ATPase subunit type 1 TsaE [Melissococcus plutonius]AIM24747.1 tRNA threonylcarbamoyladenosine biosynthesis protein TsaE [Melissococcus plutonius S1]KMT24859.1 tRNA threonylcarbamoyladenosine biosynthesis protein TsaE [Melissococcus plutonius]KMT26496.1 tRNA threonylcarbamoyladenosine biosynthesis protein TsaE [Melissococcus plutonius]KMT27746.1 tRNA threonylcarbamoyladenosine biosynthesis protein TsaE [Melissococcus plutonius]KMT
MEIKNADLETVEQLAKLIGKQVQPGNVIFLVGDLGAGKTTMTKGIAKGLDINRMVKSPTYTIIREYEEGRIPLYHMDIYRIGKNTEDLYLDEYFEGNGVSIVEWGNLLGEDTKPVDYLIIYLEKKESNPTTRLVRLQAIGRYSKQLLEQIQVKWKEERSDE